ncbi:MAG: hypothetical protein M1834_004418 [Cirrosporium novae-zelandiae]|nr:MAG: hypothetical protein M1834_004418 [Cirrosporium novae-zelandiae]
MSQYRKIELQSPADFAYLISNVERVARDKLDLHLPPAAADKTGDGGEDRFRKRVGELVDEYIHQTFQLASSSILLNGLPASESSILDPQSLGLTATEEDVYETHDPTLLTRLQSLYDALENETTRVAKLRRTAPAHAAKAYAAALEKQIKDEERVMKKEDAEKVERIKRKEVKVKLEVERLDEIEETFEMGVEGLTRLREGVGETRGRLERAGEAVKVVEGMRS